MATDLGVQLNSAVTLALAPNSTPEQRQEAYTFLAQVKDAHQQTWQDCLQIFLERANGPDGRETFRWGAQERMFAAQVVGESLSLLSPEALAFIQSSLFSYYELEYVSGPAESGVVFLKNATVKLLSLLFFQSYTASSPTFFAPFIAVLRPTPSSPLNLHTTDFFLRLLHEVSTDISDATLRLNKTSIRLNKDAELRDFVRVRDATAIAAAVWEVLGEAIENLGSEGEGIKGERAREIAIMGMKVIGDFVSWVDINLIITPVTIPFLLRALHLPAPNDVPLRTATADALLETVMKGMPPADKVALLSVLDLRTVFTTLLLVGRENGQKGADEQTELFREKLGKLLNGTGSELCKICEDATATPDNHLAANTMSTALLPLLLQFLNDSHNLLHILAVFPYATSVLGLYKKEKKRGIVMTEEKKEFLTRLLNIVVSKMEYAEDVEWSLSADGEEDDDELNFSEMRKNSCVVADAIAWIDPELYANVTQQIVVKTIEAYAAGGATAAGLTWQRVELATYLLYSFGSFSVTGPGVFVQVPQTEMQRAKTEASYKIPYTQFPLSQLGEMMLRACQAKLVLYPHPAVSLQFFEVIVRYNEFFNLCPEYINELLPSFLDEHGLHQAEKPVRARVSYLFSRFVYNAKSILQSQISGELVSNILSRMQDLLVITAELPSDEPASEALLTKAAGTPSVFDAQLNLFEVVGILISILNQIPVQQVALLRAVLSPLLAGIQQNTRAAASSPADFAAVYQAHHLMMAVGNVAKGFPDLSARSPAATGDWVEVYKEATEAVLVGAKAMEKFLVIRNAARFCFNRIVATTGTAVLPLIPTLIDCLLSQATFTEVSELLSFLGLLCAKYKVAFSPILDTLFIPVFNRVVYYLKLPIAGTDDVVQHSALRRAYFGFILSIFAANLQEILYSGKNQPHLGEVLQSVTHYIATDALAADQRYGFLVLNKLLQVWVDLLQTPGTAPPKVVPPPSPVPGFEQFMYSDVVALCFKVPLASNFDFSDAQSFQVIGEIANFLKGMHQKRGVEFVEFMTTRLWPSINCPPHNGEAFTTALKDAPDGKQFKKYLSEWLRSSRGVPQ
ncbi:exportin-T, partial [Phenoliferia sp. Uapishka_3]